MIISKKKFEAELQRVERETMERMEKERWDNERGREINERMNRAFSDIDKRLTNLENKANAASRDFPVCARY